MVGVVKGIRFIIFNKINHIECVVDGGLDLATRVKLDKGRAPLQSSTVDRLASNSKGEQIAVWLLVVDPGHLRVLSQQEISDLVDLEAYSTADALKIETREERERLGALRMRLVRTAIVPERRLKIPADAFDVCGEYLDRTHVWLEQSSSQLDVYMATYVQRVLAIPPSEFLPSTFREEE